MSSKVAKDFPGLAEVNQCIAKIKSLELPFLHSSEREMLAAAIDSLEYVFADYNEHVAEFEAEEARQKAEAIKQRAALRAICESEGHVGKWREKSELVPSGNWISPVTSKTYWVMKCTRCGGTIKTYFQPEETKPPQA